MNLKVGEVVTLKHYSGKKINKGVISNINENYFIIKPDKDFLIFNFFDNDPIVMGFEDENIVNICESTVSNIDYQQNTFGLTVNNVITITDRRVTQRFPVSLCAYILDDEEKNFAYIRNMSLEGLSICSKLEYEKGQSIRINTTIEDKALEFEALVVWKSASKYGYEYGLEYNQTDKMTMDSIEHCIEILRLTQEFAVVMLKTQYDSYKRIITNKLSKN
ncbi:PilZ domain-containing protein [Acetivibrio cellulolyticus]|uniref:PilZ domain-containing protein n=1 Tax=Acetivibrio cellulolyticus TaxID=35830 RepID=UPI0001E2C312|nr:PilZ domain-containing protein [Acetivibrio cellulolyticus]